MSTHSKIVLLAICIAVWLPHLALALPYTQPFTPVEHLSVQETIVKQAKVYAVPAQHLIDTAKCESSLNPNAINSNSREYSVGIAQINLKAHPDITKAQAMDINFAAEYMAKEFSEGRASQWTCARKLGIVQ